MIQVLDYIILLYFITTICIMTIMSSCIEFFIIVSRTQFHRQNIQSEDGHGLGFLILKV